MPPEARYLRLEIAGLHVPPERVEDELELAASGIQYSH